MGQATLLRRAEADLIVRYESHVQSVRLATVINPGLAFDFARLPRRNLIDEELLKRLASLKVPPSPPASDAAFLRRVSLDLTGEQPTPEQIRAFLADKDPDKRVKLVDRLLARPEFGLLLADQAGRPAPDQPRSPGQQRLPLPGMGPPLPDREHALGRGGDQAADGAGRPQRPGHRRPGQLRRSTPSSPTSRPSRRPSGSSASGCGAPSATTTRLTSGRRTITSAWPPSSPRSSAAGWPPGR